MSHTDEPVICPNCQYLAEKNYCAQCGQETHLHNETFMGLVAHFAGHYFHYDSKFWQTLKALWFSPGKLTLAYWNKQRMRYIPPISLYIFISAVYFLLGSLLSDHNTAGDTGNSRHKKETAAAAPVDIGPEYARQFADSVKEHPQLSHGSDTPKLVRFTYNKYKEIEKKHGNAKEYLLEQLGHNLPKLFFFMIPLMALILKMLFLGRKNLFFVNHAIFSLHYHALWFSVFTIAKIPIDAIYGWIHVVLFILVARYLSRALRNVYGIGKFQSRFYTFTIGFLYAMFFLLVLSLYVLFIFAVA